MGYSGDENHSSGNLVDKVPFQAVKSPESAWHQRSSLPMTREGDEVFP